MVAANKGWLLAHRSYYENRNNEAAKRNCKGTGHFRWPVPANPIDPYEE